MSPDDTLRFPAYGVGWKGVQLTHPPTKFNFGSKTTNL